MTRSPYVLFAMVALAAVGVLALSIGLSGMSPAIAATPQSPPTCGLICLPVPSESPSEVPRSPSPKPTVQEPSAPVKPPAPAPPPPQPAAPSATHAPEPSPTLVVATPSLDVTAGTPGTAASTAGPSTESNWNKPISKSSEATRAGAVSRGDGPGFGSPGLPAIMTGVLLVGLAGLAFAWWSRNRHFMH